MKRSFIRQSFVKPFQTGAILPSSKFLADAIVPFEDVKNVVCVVELGPGTGVFTETIIKRTSKKCVRIGFEINTSFFSSLEKEFPEMFFYNDSAENILKYLKKHKVKRCDTVISGIPWAVIPKKFQEKMLGEVVKAIKPKGIFLAFTYMHSHALPTGRTFVSLLKKHFSIVEKHAMVWKNIPPAIVYRCVK